jgi:hypothetical protein
MSRRALSPHSRELSGQGCTASLDMAANMVLAQLEPLLETQADAAIPLDPRHSTPASPSPAVAISPDIRAMCQDWGSMTSQFALQPSPGVSCLTKALRPEACAQDRTYLHAGASKTLSMIAAAEWRIDIHSRPLTSEAIQEADALRTRIDKGDSESLACGSPLIQQDRFGTQCPLYTMQGLRKRNSTMQRTPVFVPHSLGGRTAANGHQATTRVRLPGTPANHPSEARAQRRRTRQITTQPDQENLTSIQAAMPEPSACPELMLQKPLESRTNMSKLHAASLRAEKCLPCTPRSAHCPAQSEHHPLAPFTSTAMGVQEGEMFIIREEAYKPQSEQLSMMLPLQPGPTSLSGSKSTSAKGGQAGILRSSGRAVRGVTSTREGQLQHGLKTALDKCTVPTVNTWVPGKQGTAVPTYMQMTASEHAKASVAVRQITARRAGQQAKRRWSY